MPRYGASGKPRGERPFVERRVVTLARALVLHVPAEHGVLRPRRRDADLPDRVVVQLHVQQREHRRALANAVRVQRVRVRTHALPRTKEPLEPEQPPDGVVRHREPFRVDVRDAVRAVPAHSARAHRRIRRGRLLLCGRRSSNHRGLNDRDLRRRNRRRRVRRYLDAQRAEPNARTHGARRRRRVERHALLARLPRERDARHFFCASFCASLRRFIKIKKYRKAGSIKKREGAFAF